MDLTNALQNIAYSIEIQELTFFTQKLMQKPAKIIKSKEVELMLSMGRRTSTTDDSFQANQARVVEFFWNYLFNESAAQYLDKSIAQ